MLRICGLQFNLSPLTNPHAQPQPAHKPTHAPASSHALCAHLALNDISIHSNVHPNIHPPPIQHPHSPDSIEMLSEQLRQGERRRRLVAARSCEPYLLVHSQVVGGAERLILREPRASTRHIARVPSERARRHAVQPCEPAYRRLEAIEHINQQQAPRSAWQRLLERCVRREAVQEVCMCMGA